MNTTVVRRRHITNVGWRDEEELELSIPPSLRAALTRETSNPKEGEVSVRSIAEQLEDQAAVEWVQARQEPSEPGPAMVRRFKGLVREWVAEGWLLEDLPVGAPQVSQIVRLLSGETSRTLILSSIGGMDSLTLSEVSGQAGVRRDA